MMPQTTQTISSHKWIPSPLTDLMQQAFIQISTDIKLCVEVGGNPNNPPILLVMGLGSQLVFWPENFIKALINSGFYVIRFDNRDIGLSSKMPLDSTEDSTSKNLVAAMLKLQVGLDNSKFTNSYNLFDLADDTAHLIQALGVTPVHVLGASMGGMVAQILAAKYPHLVNRLALIFSTNNRAFLPPPKPKQLYTLVKRPASHHEEDIVAHGQWFINTIGTQGHIDEQAVANIAKLRYRRCYYPAGSVQQLHAIISTGSIHKYAKEIKAPTLVLHGTKDGLVPLSHGLELAKTIPNATFVKIKGMGHDLPQYYHPFIVEQLSKHMLNP